jgi:hypothetical protein
LCGAPVFSPLGAGWAVIAGITAGALVVEMNDDAKDARMERLQATLRRLKQLQDAFPPGLRETLAAVDRLTAPTRERRRTISDLPSGDHLSVVRAASVAVGPVDSLHRVPAPLTADPPAARPTLASPAVSERNASTQEPPTCPVAELASNEVVHLASELDAIVKTFEAGPTDEATAPPNVHAAMVRGLAVLLRQSLAKPRAKAKGIGIPAPSISPSAAPTVPIVNMRQGLAGTDWTPRQRAALLAQVEGHPDWGLRARKQLAYAAVEDEAAWDISVSTRKDQLAKARAEREKEAGGGAQPGRQQVRQGKRQG